MHANINFLNKQMSALVLALVFVATTAGPVWAQDASRLQERPLHTTALQQLIQPLLRGVGQGSVTTAWTVANTFGDGLDSGALVLLGGDDATKASEGGDTAFGDEDPPTPLDGEGGSGGDDETTDPPSPDYDRVVQDHLVAGIDGAAQEQSQAAVMGNYPNPFNPETTIRFEVRAPQRVRLAVFNALGQRVQVLVDGWVEAGAHQARFEAYNLPSGTYFSRLITEAGVVTSTMVLAR